MAGVDLPTMSELMGHKTIQMTKWYAHLTAAHNQAAVERQVGFRPGSEPEPVVTEPSATGLKRLTLVNLRLCAKWCEVL